MLIPLCIAVAPLLPQQDEALSFTAAIDAEELSVGSAAELRVELRWPASLSASEAGLPAPILQLDVPACMRLTEKHLSEYRELARNEFLEAPYERLLEDSSTTIPFELVSEPARDETLGLILVAYVSGADGADPRFVRERIELPLRGGAGSVDGDDADSRWGPRDGRLAIGDEAALFALPRADGTELRLADLIGAQNIVVTTYRAHW